ncbi:TPA: hypothetical protein ACSP3W_003433 [Aeromonas veronii]|uniref:hypothetical protein n=1 Tax=Aeromonas TaxID=642 RepID=UPI0022DF10ED|nr:hypothetical protein [Aeromonas sp. Y293-4]
MNHYQAIALGQNTVLADGFTTDFNHLVVEVVRSLAVMSSGSVTEIAVLNDEKIVCHLLHCVVAGQHQISVKRPTAPANEDERIQRCSALYRDADNARLRGSYGMANKLMNQATAMSLSPLVHPKALQLAKQANGLLAYGVEAICKMTAKLQTAAELLAMEQIEVNATLANIEGELMALSYLDKLELLGASRDAKVIQLGTAVANLVIGTPYRNSRIAEEVISLGERLFGAVWIDALLRA